MRSLLERQPILIRNPSSTRPWQHVLDPILGYMTLAVRLLQEPRRYSGSWNFGPRAGSIRTVEELTETIVQCWGKKDYPIKVGNGSRGEAGLLQLNCDKAHQVLGWEPRWGFERMVAETVYWYKHVDAGKEPLKMTRRQIRDYMATRHA